MSSARVVWGQVKSACRLVRSLTPALASPLHRTTAHHLRRYCTLPQNNSLISLASDRQSEPDRPSSAIVSDPLRSTPRAGGHATSDLDRTATGEVTCDRLVKTTPPTCARSAPAQVHHPLERRPGGDGPDSGPLCRRGSLRRCGQSVRGGPDTGRRAYDGPAGLQGESAYMRLRPRVPMRRRTRSCRTAAADAPGAHRRARQIARRSR